MVWIFAAVVLLLALLSPRFRKFGFVLAGAAILVIVVLILLNERNIPNPAPAAIDSKAKPATHSRISDLDDYLIERQDKDDPEAKSRISLAEVRFGQIKPTFGPQANAIQSIQARLYNDRYPCLPIIRASATGRLLRGRLKAGGSIWTPIHGVQ
jgi:hypothetical protein